MRILLVLLFLASTGCSKEKDFVPVYDVPEEFQTYVEAFVKEAADREKPIDINNLIIKFDENLKGICGSCNNTSLGGKVQKIIHINPNAFCWNIPQGKESLVFHELGHCILGRPHNNELLPNSDPKSIMVYENINLYWPCIYNMEGNDDGSCNNTFKREYYIDELFDENTLVPVWGLN